VRGSCLLNSAAGVDCPDFRSKPGFGEERVDTILPNAGTFLTGVTDPDLERRGFAKRELAPWGLTGADRGNIDWLVPISSDPPS
jgi:hypothetical protein